MAVQLTSCRVVTMSVHLKSSSSIFKLIHTDTECLIKLHFFFKFFTDVFFFEQLPQHICHCSANTHLAKVLVSWCRFDIGTNIWYWYRDRRLSRDLLLANQLGLRPGRTADVRRNHKLIRFDKAPGALIWCLLDASFLPTNNVVISDVWVTWHHLRVLNQRLVLMHLPATGIDLIPSGSHGGSLQQEANQTPPGPSLPAS